MNIADKFNKGKTVLSFEVFPPKKTSPVETIYETLRKLVELKPDFISVTYGAGGSNVGHTVEIASKLINDHKIDALAHLTCINSEKSHIDKVLEEFKAGGIENILALRGDIVPDKEPCHDFKHASDLCSYIKEKGGFYLSGACYPEVHVDAADEVEDILNLKKKVDAGVEHLITQLFFDNNAYYRFRERARIAGIDVPVSAGIMPVVNKKQIEKMVSLCGASFPAKFSKIMAKYESNPEALRDAGIAYAVEQIVDLIASGAEGIHIYTMNNPYIAEKITSAIRNLL